MGKLTLGIVAALGISGTTAINIAGSEGTKKEPTTITAAVGTQVEKVVTGSIQKQDKAEVIEPKNLVLISKVPGIKKVADVGYQNEIDTDVQKVILESTVEGLLKSPTQENVVFILQNTSNYFIKQVITELNKQDGVKHKEAFDKIASFIAPLVVRKSEVISLEKSGKIGDYILEIKGPFTKSVVNAYYMAMAPSEEKESNDIPTAEEQTEKIQEPSSLNNGGKIQVKLGDYFQEPQNIVLSTVVNLATTKGELAGDIAKKVINTLISTPSEENVAYLLKNSSAEQLNQIFGELDQALKSPRNSVQTENLIKLATGIVQGVGSEKGTKYTKIQKIIANQQINKKGFFYEAATLKQGFDELKAKLLEKAKEARLQQ